MIKTTLSFYAIKLRYRTSEIPLSTQINGFYIINKFNDFFNILPRYTPQPALPNHFPRRENDRSVYVQTIQKNANSIYGLIRVGYKGISSDIIDGRTLLASSQAHYLYLQKKRLRPLKQKTLYV